MTNLVKEEPRDTKKTFQPKIATVDPSICPAHEMEEEAVARGGGGGVYSLQGCPSRHPSHDQSYGGGDVTTVLWWCYHIPGTAIFTTDSVSHAQAKKKDFRRVLR